MSLISPITLSCIPPCQFISYVCKIWISTEENVKMPAEFIHLLLLKCVFSKFCTVSKDNCKINYGTNVFFLQCRHGKCLNVSTM